MITQDFSDFTTAGLTKIISTLSRNYQSFTFSEYTTGKTPSTSARSLLIRHDCDFSLAQALPMAKLEHSFGLKATYFILLRSPFYNAFSAEERDILYNLITLGHEVGLHFDPQYHPDLRPETLPLILQEEANLLAKVCNQTVTSFSFHLPDLGPWITLRDDKIGNLSNAYSARLFSDLRYCSDSNGYWRHTSLPDLLVHPPQQLYVLLHPEWWFFDHPLSPYERVKILTRDRGEHLFSLYEKILHDTGRENVGAPSITPSKPTT